MVGARLAEVGLEVGLERGLLELARCMELALGSCWLLERSKGPPKAMSVCCVYLGAGGFVTARQTGCPSSPLSEMLWGGDAIGGLNPLSLVGEGAATLLFLSAPDLALVTG